MMEKSHKPYSKSKKPNAKWMNLFKIHGYTTQIVGKQKIFYLE